MASEATARSASTHGSFLLVTFHLNTLQSWTTAVSEWAAESNDIVEPDDDAENGALADVGPATRESSPPSPEWAAESADIVEPDDDTFSSSGYEADFNEDTDISQ